MNYYNEGYNDRKKGICRDLSKWKGEWMKDYSLGWLQAWKDEGYKKTQLGNMPVKQVVL